MAGVDGRGADVACVDSTAGRGVIYLFVGVAASRKGAWLATGNNVAVA